MKQLRPIVVKLNLPFSPVPLGHPGREAIVGWDREAGILYLRALSAEIEANASAFSDCEICAIRLGGGHASNCDPYELERTVAALRTHYHCSGMGSISMRAAMGNISGASMPYFKRCGISRYDLGILALDRADFVRLNRFDAYQNLSYVSDYFLRAYAQPTLGYILAYGFDALDTKALRRTAVAAVRSHAVHVILEKWQAPYVKAASADLEQEQLGQLRSVLSGGGFTEYRPLHFARPGHEDPFWQLQGAAGRPPAPAVGCELLSAQPKCATLSGTPGTPCDLVGFGLGAQTRFDGALSVNTSDLSTYLAHSGDFARITAHAEPLQSGQ